MAALTRHIPASRPDESSIALRGAEGPGTLQVLTNTLIDASLPGRSVSPGFGKLREKLGGEAQAPPQSVGVDARAAMWDGRPRPSDCRKWLRNWPNSKGRRSIKDYVAIDNEGAARDAFPAHWRTATNSPPRDVVRRCTRRQRSARVFCASPGNQGRFRSNAGR